MPEIKVPEVKLPDFKWPDGLRDMNRDDIMHAARDVRMPKKSDLPDIDLSKLDLSKIDFSKVELPKQIADLHPLARAQDGIDTGHSSDERAVAFGHAAGGNQLLARRFAIGHLAQHAQRLIACCGNERAGIDDHDIGIAGLCDQRVALCGQDAAHALAIDDVLGAA